MAATNSANSSQRPLDDNHLSWQNFRLNVLHPRRIQLPEPSPAVGMPSVLLTKIQTSLENIDRFDRQRSEFRAQVQSGRGFGASPIFPPNVLPPIEKHSILQRCTSPKFSREALPIRAPAEQGVLFELPTPRPNLASGFTSEAFTEIELSGLPTFLPAIGAIVHFASGLVSPGVALYCPFFVFERVRGLKEDALETAKNQCAIGGSTCVRALQLLFSRAWGHNGNVEKPIAFSCTIDNNFAIINYHWLEGVEQYNMSSLCKFDLKNDDHFNKFQAWIQAIEDWASTQLLPKIKAALNKLATTESTPPISPMPSLSLSIDTSPGGDDTLMKALRSTFSSIKWRYHGTGATPITSSMAQCGTPLPARQIRALALSPVTPISPFMGAPFSKHGVPLSPLITKPIYSNVSPISRRFGYSPLRVSSLPPESPVRLGDVSPCSEAMEAPWSPKSPILVLQKRLDLAMDEINELKKLVEQLTGGIRTRNLAVQEDIRLIALEVFDSCVQKIDLEEEMNVQPSPEETTRSRAASIATCALQAVKTFNTGHFSLVASALALTSVFVFGRLLGYRKLDTLSYVVSSTEWFHARHLARPFTALQFPKPGFWAGWMGK